MPNKKNVLIVVGTRPDTIKLIPVYLSLLKKNIKVTLCSTGQHSEMLTDLFDLFRIRPDFDFRIMKYNQDLFDNTISILKSAKELFKTLNPSLVIVQGDTTTAMSSALAAFYLKIPIAHVEAGLRTKNILRPFPEELNRRLISLVASYHFAPTQNAVDHLLDEGIRSDRIYCTGNTVVDALLNVKKAISQKDLKISSKVIQLVRSLKGQKILLLTAHRRESFDHELSAIFHALHKVLQNDPSLHIIFPIHPNPVIQQVFRKTKLDQEPRVHVQPPLTYHDLVYVMSHVDAIATDSGGIQEEGVSLNIPVFVLRNETDRPEGIEQGLAMLVGTDPQKIIASLSKIVPRKKSRMRKKTSPYGNGLASEKIATIIQRQCL